MIDPVERVGHKAEEIPSRVLTHRPAYDDDKAVAWKIGRVARRRHRTHGESMSAAPTEPHPKRTTGPHEVRLYFRSWLLYWWPVWAVGYAMAVWTVVDDRHMVLVPSGSEVAGNTLTVPEGSEPLPTGVHVSPSRVPGLVFAFTLLVILTFGSGWVWGWRAFNFMTGLLALMLFISWQDWWGVLGRWVSYLHVYINLGGYLVISTGLLALWLIQVFIVDRRTYVVFSYSQIRVHYTIGEEEKVYDATGVSFEKAPYDWFRWLVGFGAGDLRIRIRGGQVIEIPNVVHVGRRVVAIEALLRTKDVE